MEEDGGSLVLDRRYGTKPAVVGVVVAGRTVGEDAGEDVGEDVVDFVKRYGTKPAVGGEAVGVSMGIVGVSTGIVVGSMELVDEYFALHLQYFLGGLVGAGKSGPSVGLLGGANVMSTGELRGCSTSVGSVVSVRGFSPCLAEMTVVAGCVVRR